VIKEMIANARIKLADILVPRTKRFTGNAITGFITGGDVYGKMQPTDFTSQVEANEGWVYACVSAISEGVAEAELSLHVQRGDKAEEVNDHVFLDLMQNVNPFMNALELRIITEAFQLLTGNAYWYLSKNGLGIPQEIWIVPSQDMRIVPDKNKFIKGYVYSPEGNDPVTFDPEEIVHFKYPNPKDIFYGLSPLMAAAYAVDTEKYMGQYQASLFKNDARVSAVLESDQTIQKPEADRIREQWKQYYGGYDKAGKIGILGKGLTYKSIALTSQELAFVQSKNINRDTILGIFRVPKSILGLVEDVNRANADASDYTFAKRNLSPKIKSFVEKINEKVMPLYQQSGRNYLFVKAENIVPANRELEILERNARLDKGYSTINEEREADGKDPVEWGDTPLLPINIAPLGSAPEVVPPAAPAPAPVLPADQTQPAKRKAFDVITKARIWHSYKARFDRQTLALNKTMQRLFNRQRKEVIGNLNKHKAFPASFQKDLADDVMFDFEFWEKEFIAVARVDVEAGYMAGVKHGRSLIDSSVSFGLDNPQAQAYLKEKLFRFSFETNTTTTDQLRAEIDAGLKQGETTDQIADRINKVFNFAEKYRGLRIARTETGDAENAGILDVWKADGRTEEKEWLHGGGGESPRPEHVAMTGEVVGINDTFSNGLQYPCDPSVDDPSEICNCTCTILPVIKE
jgi:HK97 family phage portal protein